MRVCHENRWSCKDIYARIKRQLIKFSKNRNVYLTLSLNILKYYKNKKLREMTV